MISPLLAGALNLGLLLLVMAMACALWRLLRGPSAQDRIVGMDCLYVNGMLFILLLGIQHGSVFYFEAALLIALFGFVGATAMAKFLLRGEVIE